MARGLPLFIDVTVLSPLTRQGAPRGRTSARGCSLLEHARDENDDTYAEVISTGLGSLQCLGCEVFGRWGAQCVKLVPALARERSRGLHPRLRRGFALSLQNRWWDILGVALQRAVAHIVLNPEGGDLMPAQCKPDFFLADLAAL